MNIENSDESTQAFTLTADMVLFKLISARQKTPAVWKVLLICRAEDPFRGCWALPGGHLEPGETFLQAAERELTEETSLTVAQGGAHLVGAYDEPNRDPRGRVISLAYSAVCPEDFPSPVPRSDATDADWVSVSWVLNSPNRIAFDHHRIIADAFKGVVGNDCPQKP